MRRMVGVPSPRTARRLTGAPVDDRRADRRRSRRGRRHRTGPTRPGPADARARHHQPLALHEHQGELAVGRWRTATGPCRGRWPAVAPACRAGAGRGGGTRRPPRARTGRPPRRRCAPNRRVTRSSTTRQDRTGSSRTNSRPPSGSSRRWVAIGHLTMLPPGAVRGRATPGRTGGHRSAGSAVRPEQAGQAGPSGRRARRPSPRSRRGARRRGRPRPPRAKVGQRRPVTVPLGGPDPGGRVLARQPGPDELAPPDQLLQPERALPGRRVEQHGLLDVAQAHADDQVGVGHHRCRQRGAPVARQVDAPARP